MHIQDVNGQKVVIHSSYAELEHILKALTARTIIGKEFLVTDVLEALTRSGEAYVDALEYPIEAPPRSSGSDERS